MSALTDDISRHHWRLGVGHPDIDVCLCGWRQQRDNGQIGYNRHLIEVTEAAVREQAAVEIEALEHDAEATRSELRAGLPVAWVEGWDSAVRTAGLAILAAGGEA